MPRPQSIRLRLARVLNAALTRVEDDLNRDPHKRLSEAEARTLKTLAQADALVQGRKAEDGEDEDPVGSASPEAAAELVRRIRQDMKAPAAPRAEGDDEDDER